MLIAIVLITQIFAFDTVKDIDIEKFMGTWYVISAIPTFAEKGCKDAYDIYTLNKDSTIKIEYHALKNDTPFTIIQKGQIIDNINNSKWRVSFIDPWIPFYTAPYEVIILDEEDYKYMVVGSTNSYGWVMSRTQTISNEIYHDILDQLKSKFGYDISKFKMVQHKNKKNIN